MSKRILIAGICLLIGCFGCTTRMAGVLADHSMGGTVSGIIGGDGYQSPNINQCAGANSDNRDRGEYILSFEDGEGFNCSVPPSIHFRINSADPITVQGYDIGTIRYTSCEHYPFGLPCAGDGSTCPGMDVYFYQYSEIQGVIGHNCELQLNFSCGGQVSFLGWEAPMSAVDGWSSGGTMVIDYQDASGHPQECVWRGNAHLERVGD